MTAIVQVNEQYVQRFNEMIQAFPQKAIKLILVKNNLNDEITKRINEIKNHTVATKPLDDLTQLIERYASDRDNSEI